MRVRLQPLSSHCVSRRSRLPLSPNISLGDVQSASTEYFRKARTFLMDHGRLEAVPQIIVNPEDTAFSNLTSTCTNTQALNLTQLQTTADLALEALAAAVTGDATKLAELRESAAGGKCVRAGAYSSATPATSCEGEPAVNGTGALSPTRASPALAD